MFAVYSPLLLMILVAVGLALVLFLLAVVLGNKNMTPEKALPYESGQSTGDARHIRLSVTFFLTAIVFTVFDIEAVFLFPWAAMFRELGWFGLMEMLAFILILGVTLVYAFRKGAFEWEK
jgi:NADH-quinone oxidoreductase subunit A